MWWVENCSELAGMMQGNSSSLSGFSLQPNCSAMSFSCFPDLAVWTGCVVLEDRAYVLRSIFPFLVEWAHWLVNSGIVYVEVFYYFSKEELHWKSGLSKSPDPRPGCAHVLTVIKYLTIRFWLRFVVKWVVVFFPPEKTILLEIRRVSFNRCFSD